MMMNEYSREAELQYAQEMVTALREAYKTQAGRGGVKAYKIKDREMTFHDAADMLKQLQYWQRRVQELEQQLGISTYKGPPQQIITRFRR